MAKTSPYFYNFFLMVLINLKEKFSLKSRALIIIEFAKV
jgi:hypothetical protein